VSYGATRNNVAVGNPEPTAVFWSPSLKTTSFLVTVFSAASISSLPLPGSTASSCRVEEGSYENGVFKVPPHLERRRDGLGPQLLARSRWCCASRWPPLENPG